MSGAPGSGWGCRPWVGGRVGNHAGNPRDLLPVEIWGATLEEADCLRGATGRREGLFGAARDETRGSREGSSVDLAPESLPAQTAWFSVSPGVEGPPGLQGQLCRASKRQ